MQKIHDYILDNKKLIIYAFVSTVVLGLFAHAVGLFNISPVHDALWEFSNSWQHKVSIGRFLAPFVRTLMGETIILPWLTGFVAIFFIALSVYFVCKMFEIKNFFYILIISGICVTNLTVTSLLAAFTHDFAGDMIALSISVYAAYNLTKHIGKLKIKNVLISAICSFVSLAIYQAYFAVTVTLLFIFSISKILNEGNIKVILKFLLLSISVLVVVAIVYAIFVYVISLFFSVSVDGSYNSITQALNIGAIFSRIPRGIFMVIRVLFLPNNEYAVKATSEWGGYLICLINIFLLLISAYCLIKGYVKKEVAKYCAPSLICLLILLPLAMSCIYLLFGTAYILLAFPCWYYYLLVIQIVDWAQKKHIFKIRKASIISLSLILIIVFSNVQVANAVYTKKELEKQATLVFMTRVLKKIEEQENYVYNETPIAIVGEFYKTIPEIAGTEEVNHVDGVQFKTPLSYSATLYNYFDVVLQYKANMCDGSTLTKLRKMEEVKNMPIFPNKDSVRIIDGIIVVKIGEIE